MIGRFVWVVVLVLVILLGLLVPESSGTPTSPDLRRFRGSAFAGPRIRPYRE